MNTSRVLKYGTIIFVALLFLIITNTFLFSGPQLEAVIKTVKDSPVINSEFGGVENVQVLHIPGSKRKWMGNGGLSLVGVWHGTYFFEVIGKKKKGIIKVDWREESNQPIQILRIFQSDESGTEKMVLSE